MLSDRRVFLAVGGVLGVLGVLSFIAVAILEVMTGHWLNVYYTPRLGPVLYVVALATVPVVIVALIFAGTARFIQWYRQRP
jgi:hypothetical protein